MGYDTMCDGAKVPTFCSPIPPDSPENGGNKSLRNSNNLNNLHCCQDRQRHTQKTALTSPDCGRRQDITFRHSSFPSQQAACTVNGVPNAILQSMEKPQCHVTSCYVTLNENTLRNTAVNCLSKWRPRYILNKYSAIGMKSLNR
jgi:hypothetical protein